MVSRRAGLRDRWRDQAVIPNTEIGDACKVLLLVMATKMTDRGYLAGVSREHLAETLGVHPRRIAERIDTAKRHELLVKVGGGYHGRTAEYVAVLTLPMRAAQRHSSPLKVAGERHPLSVTLSPGESGAKGAAQRHTNTRVTYPSRKTSDDERNAGVSPTSDASKDGSDERAPAGFPLAAVSPTDERTSA